MYLAFLKPEVFDAIIIINIVFGLVIAGRRFLKEIRGPLPDDAPPSVHDACESSLSSSTPSGDS